MNFVEKLTQATIKNKSLVCVGLDPDPTLMPDKVSVLDFNRAIIDATSDLVCAYKLNFAFYEMMEDEGIKALRESIKHIPNNVVIIGDAKRGDIGNTSKAYAKSIFDNFGCDATTVSPYLGFDSLEPFIQYREKGIFVLCRTSNKGAVDFQSLKCDGRSLFEIVADKVSQWNTNGNLGLVVGATYPDELKLIRRAHPDIPLLIPGIGAQGGEVSLTIRYGVNAQGQRAIINSSRQIIYASKGKDFPRAARRAATELRDQINSYLPK
ncbi:MAG: orotidine-5'-phosphate decarboxylase [Dehalococcoidales bacterium]|nr:orotidine-5'-phosphate decarboxylase [Dehalococcoidales bacterium]